MTGDDLTALLEPVSALARRAGERILDVYNGPDFDISAKDDSSPLTAADLASHKVIVAGLAELTPTIPVLSEESASIDYAERQSWQRYWLVDPLDGTKEFIKRNGEFTVNIALIEGNDVALGVVDVPVQSVCYRAARGAGAARQPYDQPPQPINVNRHRADSVKVVGSRSHAGASLQAFVDKLGHHELVAIGSSLKFCLVAEGRADVYPRLGPTSEWDTAAAQCVVEQAGGQVLTLAGQPLRYNTKETLLNPYFIVCGGVDSDTRSWLEIIAGIDTD